MQVLLTTAELVVHHSDQVWKALQAFKKGSADFADYLIAFMNKSQDCDKTVTFDQQAAKGGYFQLL